MALNSALIARLDLEAVYRTVRHYNCACPVEHLVAEVGPCLFCGCPSVGSKHGPHTDVCKLGLDISHDQLRYETLTAEEVVELAAKNEERRLREIAQITGKAKLITAIAEEPLPFEPFPVTEEPI